MPQSFRRGLAGLYGIWAVIRFYSEMSDLAANPLMKALGANISIGMGLYLLIIAGVAIPAAAFILRDKTQPETPDTEI